MAIPLLLCACAKQEQPKTAKALIEAGQLQQAYDLLLALENPTGEEKELLSGFSFREIENVGSNGYSLKSTYDEKGQLLTRDRTEQNGFWSKTACTYDEAGHMLTEHFSCFHGTPEEFTYTYTYDEMGRMLTKDYAIKGGKWEKTVWTYDKDGNLLTESFSDSKGDWRTDIRTYDEQGRLLTQATDNAYGAKNTYIFTYDEKGNQLSFENQFDTPTQGKGWKKTVSTYDAQGNKTSEVKSTHLGEEYITTYTYDDSGNTQKESGSGYEYIFTHDTKGNILTVERTDVNGSGRKIVNTYDDSGNLLTEEHWSKTGLLGGNGYTDYYKYTYTYDARGNQLSQEHVNNKNSWTKSVWTYDEKDNILTESISTDKGPEREEISTYDTYGNRITRECTYKEQPKVTYTSKWQLYYNPVLAAQLAQDETQPEQPLD